VKEHTLIPVHEAIDDLFGENVFNEVNSFCFPEVKSLKKIPSLNSLTSKTEQLVSEINRIETIPLSHEDIVKSIKDDLSTIKSFSKIWESILEDPKIKKSLADTLGSFTLSGPISAQNGQILLVMLIIKSLNQFNSNRKDHGNIFDHLWIGKKLAELFDKLQFHSDVKEKNIALVRCLGTHKELLSLEFNSEKPKPVKVSKQKSKGEITEPSFESVFLHKLFESYVIRDYLNYNEYDGIFYYSKERFEYLLDWLFTLNSIYLSKNIFQDKSTIKKKTLKASKDTDKEKIDSKLKKQLIDMVKKNFEFFDNLKKASEEVGYKVDDLIKRFEVESHAIVEKSITK
jgi:hypothetical protein